MKNPKKSVYKVFSSAVVKVVDAEQMIIDHCISDDQPDRANDTISLEGWVTDNYLQNPVVLDIHDYGAPPVAKCQKLYTSGNQLRAQTQFAPTDRGKMYFELYSGGFMRAFSVGFIPEEYEANKEGYGYHYTKQELLEYSVVPVPCNPRALKGHNIKIGAEISKANRDMLEQVMALLDQAYALVDEVLEIEEGDDEQDAPADQQTDDNPDAGKSLYESLKAALTPTPAK